MSQNSNDSSVVYTTKLHWVIFLGPVFSLIAAIALHITWPKLDSFCMILETFALFWIAMTWVIYQFSSITIKKRQVILRTGFLVRKTTDISLAKIETVNIRQSIMGSLFQYGLIIITGTGGTRHAVNYIAKPLTCRRHIEQLMNEPH